MTLPPDSPAQPFTTGDEPTPALDAGRGAEPGPTHPAGQGRILAIDPGNTESAYAVIDRARRRPLWTGKIHNVRLLDRLPGAIVAGDVDTVAIEMVASYGMPVGREVFETCVWVGRFQQEAMNALIDQGQPYDLRLIYRQPVKLHHCHTSKAKDSNITQALVDRFVPGQPNRGKGTKTQPGWFHGFAADIWQAYALAVYIADTTISDPVSAPAAVIPPCTAGADQNTRHPEGPAEGEAAGTNGCRVTEEALFT